ncbi:unnamed protein product, partial [Coregonus sp. 'balchen']
TAVFSLAPAGEKTPSRPVSVACWDLLRKGVQGEWETPQSTLPTRHMLFSCLPTPDPGPVAGPGSWSLPAPIRPDFPRQSVAVPGEICSSSGLSTRWVKQSGAEQSGALVMTYQEHLGITYVTLNEDPCPHMLIHNQTPLSMLLRENVKESPRTEVYCRPLPANSSLHHGLYHHYSSFPDCRQREPLPTLLLKTSPNPDMPPGSSLQPSDLQTSPEWSD